MTQALRIPVADSEGVLYQQVGRYAGRMVLIAFDMVGGVDRLADWADKNYGEFATKLLPKLITKPVEVSASEGIESLLERLDASDRAMPIDGESRVIYEEA